MGKDYYAMLGLQKDFSPDDLKKAYRKAATKYHPDKIRGSEQEKNAGAEKFKEIGEAYDVLSDPQKKQIYDMYGEEGLKSGVPPGGGAAGPEGFRGGYSFSPDMANSIFEELFGGMGGMGGGFGMGGMGGGAKKTRGGMGGMFGGMGGGPAGFSFFGGPGGFGEDTMMSDQGMGGAGPGKQEVELPVSLEQLFTGVTKKLKVTRRIVDGASGRMVPIQEVVEIAIKPGWKEGTRITFEGKGDERPGGAPSDLVFKIKEQQHPRFTRKGNDLHTTVKVPLVTALTGGAVSIPHFNSKTLPLQLRDIMSPGQERSIGGEGMPISKQPGKRGDLVVRFEVSFPRSLSDDQKTKLRSILPSS